METAPFWLSDQHATTVCTKIQRRIERILIWADGCLGFNRFGERARTFGTPGRHDSRPPIFVLSLEYGAGQGGARAAFGETVMQRLEVGSALARDS
ncbi:hypothetical protein RSK20926_19342 [Roseobacter sp. SK209-2-6]|nr:hypothetical protein RSK20926_19342 [Roseobacter sp. SK209-2-6]